MKVPSGSHTPYFQSIRRGISANIEDKYQNDYARKAFSYSIERDLLLPMLRDMDVLKNEFLKVINKTIVIISS